MMAKTIGDSDNTASKPYRHQKLNKNVEKPNIKLLLALEDRATANIIEQMQEKIDWQYQIISLHKTTELVQALQQQNVDLLLVQTSQIDVISHLSQSISTPIVTLIEPKDRPKAIAALAKGVQAYICKDEIEPNLLNQTIHASIQRQKLVNQQKEQLKRYRSIVESQTELVCHFTVDGTLSYVNQIFANLWQQSINDIVGKSWFELITPQDLELVILSLVQLTSDQANQVQAVECRVNTPNGQIWLHWQIKLALNSTSQLEYEATGKKIASPEYAQNPNLNLRLRAKLEEQEFQRMADRLPILVWIANSRGQIDWVNKAWLHFSGRSLCDEQGTKWLSLVDPDEREMCWYAFGLGIQQHNCLHLEHRMRRYDGEYRWFLNTGAPRFDANKELIGYVGTCVDITKEKNAEALLAEQARWERLTSKITQHLHQFLDTSKIMAIAAQDIHDYLNVDQLFIVSVISSLQVHKDNNDQNFSQTTVLIEQLQAWIANSNLAQGEAKIINNLQIDVADDPYLQQQQQLGVKSLLLLPIMIKQQLWGVIYVRHSSSLRCWNHHETRWLTQIAKELAIAIEKAEIHQQLILAKQELEIIATIDRLTGIANRREFDQYLNQEWQRIAREKRYLSLIMIDIDYFKQYNDKYGHPAGDGCLQKVARAISAAAKRPADLAARYGGEEFAVILPATNQRGAIYVAEEIRRRVENLKIKHCGSEVSPYVTCSLGISCCIPQSHLATDLLLVAADQALYNAKTAGRNRVAWDHTLILD